VWLQDTEGRVKLRPLVDELYIVEKSLQVSRLGDVINWAQAEVIREVERAIAEGRPIRLVILKARQIGISTIIQAILFALAMITENLHALVIGQEIPNSHHLLAMSHHYWDTFPFRETDIWKLRSKAQNQMVWDHGAQIKVATAKNVSTGRGQTIQFFHGSEVAFWDKAELLMTGLQQTIPFEPYTFQFVESTANGVGGFFHQMWVRASSGDPDYPFTPLFFPWHMHPAYKAAGSPLGHLDDEERILSRLLRNIDDLEARLRWRRKTLAGYCQGDLLKLHQEYPTTPEEAFVSTGRNVFAHAELKAWYVPKAFDRGKLSRDGQKVRFIRSSEGELRVYRRPNRDRDYGQYVIGGDMTRSIRGDYSVMQVVHRRTKEPVATWRARCHPNEFANQMMMLGKFYNTAILAPEATGEGGGKEVVGAIIQAGYPRLWQSRKTDKMYGQLELEWGWRNNTRNKESAIARLVRYVHDAANGDPSLSNCRLHDARTYDEMTNYVVNDKGQFENSADIDHDDCVDALYIAYDVVDAEAMYLPPYGTRRPQPIAIGDDELILGKDSWLEDDAQVTGGWGR
jgi:hypothetical protein